MGGSTGVRPWVVGVAAAVSLAVAVLVAVAGYRLVTRGAEPMGGVGAAKTGVDEVREDLEPLRKRFPPLAGATGARWMSGTYGRGDAPGPSTYWIDAVVTLPADEVRRLVAAHGPTAQGRSPEVVAGLRERVPAGPFLTGEAFDRAFTHERWTASAFLDERSGQVVVVATGT
ncbi:hypothetical protein [Saccharothrix australiensis]|uniref:Uncharacterized protein n=1 Tax=Saccharothrix australiensis TaxID=2072 RepID=A0A495W3Z5_9PSEU|nr:hypothetical protein [Saccharothrix australiensis]RKT55820.1 hypothetical protein C8E97_4507 [Saccharothrix australiensis]